MSPTTVTHLRALEAEAVHIMREVAAERERLALMFSGGKDSIVLLRLAEKAFRPGRFPFPLLQVATGHDFPEVLAFRDRRVEEVGARLVVASVQEAIDAGRVRETGESRNRLQTPVLLEAIADERFDALFGGARRDEARGLWKYNPLVDWTDDDVWARISERGLPYHALHDMGYASIGCATCTAPGTGREGRWAGLDKTECGLHVPPVVRAGS